MVSVFKNAGERSTAKNYCLVSLLSVVSKVFEKLVNNRIVDHLEKCGLFSDFHYGSRSSRSTADLLTVVSGRIARAFNRSGATRTMTLDMSKAFGRVWHADLLHKLNSYGIVLLSMVMILLSTLSVIGHLICDNNLNWLLNLNLMYKTLWTGVRSGLLISMLGKVNCFV